MNQIYKNPTFYHILVPIIVALWPLFIRTVYLPEAKRSWQNEKTDYKKAQDIIAGILALDPGRLEFADSKTSAAEFDYANVVEKIADLFGIPSTNYKLSSGPIIKSGGQKSQSAKVILQEVDIARFAKFLSMIQLRWANLQCAQLKLDKRKGLPDTWGVDLEFKYYY